MPTMFKEMLTDLEWLEGMDDFIREQKEGAKGDVKLSKQEQQMRAKMKEVIGDSELNEEAKK